MVDLSAAEFDCDVVFFVAVLFGFVEEMMALSSAIDFSILCFCFFSAWNSSRSLMKEEGVNESV